MLARRLALTLSLSLATLPAVAAPEAPDGSRIEAATGLKGKLDAQEGVFTVRYPRADLAVEAAGVRLTPPLGLTAWAAFSRMGGQAMVMGDMVLTEDQVAAAMDAALGNGLAVTALHNHFFWERPRVMFMHVAGQGDEAALAAGIGKVFAAIKATAGGKGEVPRAAIDPATSTLDGAALDAIVGAKGETAQGVHKIVVGRKVMVGGHVMGKAMGVNTWAAFAGAPDQAVVDGDFAMRESELQGVLKALRRHGIRVVAIHNHMTHEIPRFVFLHYWGVGPAADLARGVRAGLDATRPGPAGD